MLEPEYLLRISEGAEVISQQLHEEILQRIVKRILKRLDRKENYILTAQDKWQIKSLTESGKLLEEIQALIAKKTKLQQKEIKEAMEEAGVRALDLDDSVYQAAGLSTKALTQSPGYIRLMQRAYEATLGEWKNFTRTTATASQQAFIAACDKAYNLVTSGALSYTQAVREAVNDIVEEGVVVHYPSGHTDTIETATLRAVRTGVSQATAEIQLARMNELDWDIVLVSAHLGARPEHHKWQGKFYSRSGRDKRFPDFVASTGYGTVTGLCGANCRHSFGPGDGVNNPYDTYDSEENQKAYDLQQRQRLLERRIRKTKRQVMGLKAAADEAVTPELKAGFTLDYEKKSALLSKQNAAYKQFCKENNLKELSDRLAIAKWDRQQAAEARGAYRTVANKANKLYNGSAEENLNNYLHHIKDHDLMEKNGIVFKRWINDKEAVVNAGKRIISSERVHAVENRELKADRAEMTIDVAQTFIDNSKLTLYQNRGKISLKYIAENGYTVINLDNELVTAVPQKWRNKYNKFLEEENDTSK